MGLRHNPITYLVLSNGLLWGLPLAINHWQASLPSGPRQPVEVATNSPSAQVSSLTASAFRHTADALLAGDPLLSADSLPGATTALAGPGAAAISTADNAAPAVVSAISQRPFQFSDGPLRPASPDLLSQLRGADGLGGAITLASLNEPAVPIAARAEQLEWQRSNDALAALPLHWREPLRRELGDRVRVSQAATVRLPVRDLAERQEVPVIITDQGVAEGLVKPRNARTREAVETWAARQRPSQAGTVQVMVVAAEPVEAPAVEAGAVVAAVPAVEQRAESAAPPPLPPIPESAL